MQTISTFLRKQLVWVPNENAEKLKSAGSALEKLWRWNRELSWFSGWAAGSWWDRSSSRERESPEQKKVGLKSSCILKHGGLDLWPRGLAPSSWRSINQPPRLRLCASKKPLFMGCGHVPGARGVWEQIKLFTQTRRFCRMKLLVQWSLGTQGLCSPAFT